LAANNYHEEEILGKAYDSRLMRRLLTYVRPYKTALLIAVILLIVGSGLQLLLPVMVQNRIDDHLAFKDVDVWEESRSYRRDIACVISFVVRPNVYHNVHWPESAV